MPFSPDLAQSVVDSELAILGWLAQLASPMLFLLVASVTAAVIWSCASERHERRATSVGLHRGSESQRTSG